MDTLAFVRLVGMLFLGLPVSLRAEGLRFSMGLWIRCG